MALRRIESFQRTVKWLTMLLLFLGICNSLQNCAVSAALNKTKQVKDDDNFSIKRIAMSRLAKLSSLTNIFDVGNVGSLGKEMFGMKDKKSDNSSFVDKLASFTQIFGSGSAGGVSKEQKTKKPYYTATASKSTTRKSLTNTTATPTRGRTSTVKPDTEHSLVDHFGMGDIPGVSSVKNLFEKFGFVDKSLLSSTMTTTKKSYHFHPWEAIASPEPLTLEGPSYMLKNQDCQINLNCKPKFIKRIYRYKYKTEDGGIHTFNEKRMFELRPVYFIQWYISPSAPSGSAPAVRFARVRKYLLPAPTKFRAKNKAQTVPEGPRYWQRPSSSSPKNGECDLAEFGEIDWSPFYQRYQESFPASQPFELWRISHRDAQMEPEFVQDWSTVASSDEKFPDVFIFEDLVTDRGGVMVGSEPDISNPPDMPDGGKFIEIEDVSTADEDGYVFEDGQVHKRKKAGSPKSPFGAFGDSLRNTTASVEGEGDQDYFWAWVSDEVSSEETEPTRTDDDAKEEDPSSSQAPSLPVTTITSQPIESAAAGSVAIRTTASAIAIEKPSQQADDAESSTSEPSNATWWSSLRTVVLDEAIGNTCTPIATNENGTMLLHFLNSTEHYKKNLTEGGVEVVLYEETDLAGKAMTITLSPKQCLSIPLIEPDWNGVVASINPGNAPCTMIWEKEDCTGKFACFKSGSTGAMNFSSIFEPDDKFKSIQLC